MAYIKMTYEELEKGVKDSYDNGYQAGFCDAMRKIVEHDAIASQKRYHDLLAMVDEQEYKQHQKRLFECVPNDCNEDILTIFFGEEEEK